MRIIAGEAKGRSLKGPKSTATRPTSDKVRGSIFGMLESLADLSGVRVLDLYAGTGALAMEALSRGAAWADLVEKSSSACDLIRSNLAQLGLAGQARVHCMAVRRALNSPYFTDGPAYDIILLDPPYADPGIAEVMGTLAASTLVGRGTIVVLEHARRFAVQGGYGRLELIKTRCHGDTCVSLFTGRPEPSA